MLRIVATTATSPWAERNACSAGDASRWISENDSSRAEDFAALPGKSVGEAVRERADRGDRQHAERDAGEEDVEAAQSATQLAQREPQHEPGVTDRRRHASGRLGDLAGAQADHPVAARRERGVVRHQHERHVALGVAREHQVDDLAAGRLVEISGRLVGDEDRRIRHQRPRERDALLLAARKLRRVMAEPRREPDRHRARPWRGHRHRRRRRARAGRRRFPAPSWSGSGGTTGTRCRSCGRGTAPAHPRRAGRCSRHRPRLRPNRGVPVPP